MTEPPRDPLTVLAAAVEPSPPDPSFAARLRARLARALDLPEGVTVSDVTRPDRTTTSAGPPDTTRLFPRPAALPYLSVRGAAEAIAWYVEVFAARQVGEPYLMPGGKIGHAELELGDGTLYLAEEFPDMGLVGPASDVTSVSLMLPVEDTVATLERARSNGARIEREPYDEYGGRNASLVDPFGHRWMLYQPLGGS